jgi:hypothetical protein
LVVKLPSGIYFELLRYARENHISVQQLALEFIRFGFAANKIWECKHEEEYRKFSRKTKQWYCSNCWTFLDRRITGRSSTWEPRKPCWENTMTPEEWSRQIVPENRDLK